MGAPHERLPWGTAAPSYPTGELPRTAGKFLKHEGSSAEKPKGLTHGWKMPEARAIVGPEAERPHARLESSLA
ncbi:hypothetical protein Ssi02_68100 [Sinosporangium siamense]|uniref:Uncharacterized protein n=1 Tax=Sinosporangium siamense TaxID=1367973 RepID=A0A919RQW7_9ACTN|nr:hypothetical protein Ssi02_68100 [Sinosporangium siamense]